MVGSCGERVSSRHQRQVVPGSQRGRFGGLEHDEVSLADAIITQANSLITDLTREDLDLLLS